MPAEYQQQYTSQLQQQYMQQQAQLQQQFAQRQHQMQQQIQIQQQHTAISPSAPAFVPSAAAAAFVPAPPPVAPPPAELPECFLSGAELGGCTPDQIVESLSPNLPTGPHYSLLHYLETQYNLLRYDAFAELHERVHVLHSAQQDVRIKLKSAGGLKLLKSYFSGVRTESIDFERPAASSAGVRGQSQRAPMFVMSWDQNKTAEMREQIIRTHVSSHP